jgi:hypothetical protein
MRVENIALEPVLRFCTLLMENVSLFKILSLKVSRDSNGQGGKNRSCGEQSKGHLPEHHVDIDLTLERSRQDMNIANANIYYYSSARSRPLEGIANSSLRMIESEGAAEIARFMGYPQLLLCVKLSWIKAPRGTPETYPLTIERRVYMVHDYMVHPFTHRQFLGVPRT